MINFEQVVELFLVLNNYLTYQWLIALFTRVLLRVTVYNYYVTFASVAVARICSVKKTFLEISQNSQENACARVSFLIFFLTEHLWWLLLAFQSEYTLYSFRRSCSKQAQYLKFKRTKTSWKYNRSNIVQTSFLCYVAGF